MLALGIDTSNYATSLAVVSAAGEVICSEKQFLPVREGETGLRQSDAVFAHTAALPALLEKMQGQGFLRDIGAVGVSAKPRPVAGSYMPCFLAGVSAATAFAAGREVQLVQTSHQQGHVAAALLGAAEPALLGRPILCFHISGGTTELLHTDGSNILGCLGRSLDLYAGQAVDRLGVRLGFAFPAGEALSALALTCDDEMHPKISVKGTDCHLSGLQNQCEALLRQGKPAAYVARYCLVAIADTVAAMVEAARAQLPGLPVLCAGGVMASEVVRRRLTANVADIHFAPARFSADNAMGIAHIAAGEVAGHG